MKRPGAPNSQRGLCPGIQASAPRLCVMCSGNGSNLQALINARRRGDFPADIVLVISDVVDAFALARARRAGIAVMFLEPRDYPDRAAYEQALLRRLRREAIDFIALAGFMRILSPVIVRRFRGRIVNIHPSLLPAFPGRQGVADALEYGVKMSGVTVHFVDEQVDHGPIIAQAAVPVRAADTVESLSERIHRAEHRLYPRALRMVFEGRITISGRKVVCDEQ